MADGETLSTNRNKRLSRPAVADAIRQGIRGGDLVPGQRLVEAEIGESLGASRGTVRAALMDLVHDGLVEHIANRGARVRVVSLEEALDLAEVRLAVESLCVAKAAEKITDDEIKNFRHLAKHLRDRAKRGDAAGFAELTHQIFETYIRIADQPVAKEVLVRLRDRNNRHRFRLTYRPDRSRVSLPFWLNIIDTICDRDPNAALQALQRHSENVQEAMKAIAQDRSLLTAP